MSELRLSRWQRLLWMYGRITVLGRRLPRGRLTASLRNMAVRGFYPRHVFDLGANRATWSARVHAVFPRSTLTLVEPLAEMKPHLDAFCAKVPNARWIQAAVGAANGEQPFAVHGLTDSTLAVPEGVAQAAGQELRTVKVVTIDHLAQTVIGAVPELIKMDVEGYEFEALKGASSCLGETELFVLEVPFWPMHETGKIFSAAVQAMADYGYEVYDFTNFQLRKYDSALGQADVVFARREGALRSHLGWR